MLDRSFPSLSMAKDHARNLGVPAAIREICTSSWTLYEVLPLSEALASGFGGAIVVGFPLKNAGNLLWRWFDV